MEEGFWFRLCSHGEITEMGQNTRITVGLCVFTVRERWGEMDKLGLSLSGTMGMKYGIFVHFMVSS